MNIDQIHNWINFVVNKATGAYYSPGEIDQALHRAQMEFFNAEYEQYAESERLQASLAPFKSSFSFNTGTTSGGLITLPSDYAYLLGCQITVVDNGQTKQRPLRIVEEDELADRLNSQLRPVAANKPIGTEVAKGVLQVYPASPVAGKAFYLSMPVAPVWGYTQSGRTLTYNPSTSTQLLFQDYDINQIMDRAVFYLGVNVADEGLMGAMGAKIKENL